MFSPHSPGLLACALLLAACATHGKKEAAEPQGARLKSLDSFGMDSIKRGDNKKMSPMDQKTFSATKAFAEKKEFYTKAFGGNKTFHSGHDDFVTKESAFAKKESREGAREFRSGRGDNALGDKVFATKESKSPGKEDMDAAKLFGGTKSFYTKDNYEAQKAVRESRKPLIVGDQSDMSVDQLQKLLNKN